MLLKRVVLSSLLGVACATMAPAADLPRREGSPAFIAATPAAAFNGFYAGLGAGVGWGAGCETVAPMFPGLTVGWVNPGCGTGGSSQATALAGAQAGYNLRLGQTVLGVEADLMGVGNRRGGSVVSPFPAGAPGLPAGNFVIDNARQPNLLSTLRARFGYVFGETLVFATGGLVVGGGARSHVVSYWPGAIGGAPSAQWRTGSSGATWGWSAGVGAETMISASWSLKAEYVLAAMTVSDRNVTACSGAGCAGFNQALSWVDSKRNTYENTVRVGVNYHFGR